MVVVAATVSTWALLAPNSVLPAAVSRPATLTEPVAVMGAVDEKEVAARKVGAALTVSN